MPGLTPAHAGKTNARRGMKYRGAAHPRSRGENQSRVRRHTPPPGSSPLTRGKQSEGTGAFTHHGLIPAHAGKTLSIVSLFYKVKAHPRSRGENPANARAASSTSGSSPLTRGKLSGGVGCELQSGAHPRSRGENSWWSSAGRSRWGSSPLTRGKLAGHDLVVALAGLIPAHAGKTWLLSVVSTRPRAHPRSRGENSRRRPAAVSTRGSSPLTRGKPLIELTITSQCGLIPAHAGKTAIGLPTFTTRRAHPRSRGENHFHAVNNHAGQGSSPLTRGKRGRCPSVRRVQRLIPAHAGKTSKRPPPSSSNGAHPRSRGENHSRIAVVSPSMGSSPLTRGKRFSVFIVVLTFGLIPAHAGKTGVGAVARVGVGAHPRSRGENCCTGAGSALNAGSSPLTRGKPPEVAAPVAEERLIPAHAGKTTYWTFTPKVTWAHPRSRGENFRGLKKQIASEGSSPLTRGKRTRHAHARPLSGLIPAHAGKTISRAIRSISRRAHPRSRGENVTKLATTQTHMGSSPLTRGKREPTHEVRNRRRLIPAHAGKTTGGCHFRQC